MLAPVQAAAGLLPAGIVPLQISADLFTTDLGKLLIALVVIAVVLFVGRFVLSVAWRLLRIAIVVVAALWVVSVVAPRLMG